MPRRVGNLTATDRANIANGSFRFVNSRLLADVGIRDEKFQRDTYRVVGGLRGSFNDDWNYESSVNYGKFKEDTTPTATSTSSVSRWRWTRAGTRNGANPVPLAI